MNTEPVTPKKRRSRRSRLPEIRNASDRSVHVALRKMARRGRIERKPSLDEVAAKVGELGFTPMDRKKAHRCISRLEAMGYVNWCLEVRA